MFGFVIREDKEEDIYIGAGKKDSTDFNLTFDKDKAIEFVKRSDADFMLGFLRAIEQKILLDEDVEQGVWDLVEVFDKKEEV